MKRRTQISIRQLYVIALVWLVVGLIITVYDYFVIHTHSSIGPTADYSFLFSLALNSAAALIGASIGGSFLVFYINVKYRDKPYGYTIIAVSLSFILIVSFIAFTIGIITGFVRDGKSITELFSGSGFPGLSGSQAGFPFDSARTIKNTIVWSVVVGLTQLFLQMNSKFGYGVFWNILRGKYNTPKEEHRIFMSLDLNSSTTIAEELGNEKYHALLKDFYSDITNPIIDNKGEIYQYVGDEVIIAWKYEDGIARNQCLKCFFDMKEQFEINKDKYLHRYGTIPSFKAGLHWGKVIVGEVGIIKRDITYSGDVLNTTSRIRDKCKEFNVEVIASADLLNELDIFLHDKSTLQVNYVTRQLGAINLRGKGKEIILSALVPAEQ
ncbi:MAG: adenylate/guanylate cyclase domain-containing protein [Ignavibacteriaceae bacterium]